MDEFDIIKKYFAPLAIAEEGAFALTDDAAIARVPDGMELVITKDAITEGVHFIGNETPELIASKLLRVNLSDLAAMGAKPYGYLLALMLPEKTKADWIAAFAKGLKQEQEKFRITLLGGDTTRTKSSLSISLTAMGYVPKGNILRRNGAKAGDIICVSGTLGDAALGLFVAKGKLKSSHSEYLLGRYQVPQPRITLGQCLLGVATSCMDISDGLIQDLGHIADTSHLLAEVHWQKIPLSEAVQEILPTLKEPYEAIVAGGDDYELLFTLPKDKQGEIQALSSAAGVRITVIGSMKTGEGTKLIDKTGKDIYLSKRGFNHFGDI